MPGQTQLIIITTDEDIIRQFSLNKSTNTQLIDLDKNSEQIISKKTTNDDIINLPFLAELSKLNSSNDQMYKRALDSTDTVSSKSIKTPRRSIDLICGICGDKAIGYNYDALSCGSCKVFFYRNANKSVEDLRCFTGEGQCSVAHDIRRKCPKCRLERCFAVGMRKDFMQTTEDKQQQKNNPEQNPNMTLTDVSLPVSNPEDLLLGSDELDRLLNDISENNDNNIFDEDWIIIEDVRLAFASVFENDVTKYPSYDCVDSISALINWSSCANENALNFIKFFRQINEFEELDPNDRFVLIKYNLFSVYPILKCFYYHKEHEFGLDIINEEKAKFNRFYTLCCGSYGTHQTYVNLVLSLIEATEQDTTILSLFLVILMFSQGLSMKEDEPILKDQIQVNKAQSHYVKTLWNYMIHKWGDIEAHKRFIQLLSITFRMQTISKMLCGLFRTQLITSDAADKIAPLMRTVLHIS